MIYDIIKECIISSWPLLSIVGISYIIVRIFYLSFHRQSISFSKEFFTLLSILYLLLLFQIVLKDDINEFSGVNLVPFEEILRWKSNEQMFIYNVIGNILLFIPFGYIISSYIKPRKIWPIIFSSSLITTAIEFIQHRVGRSFDIDDIILNVLGTILGYVLYKILKWAYGKLPNFAKSETFKTIFCIVLLLCIVLYILNIMEIKIGI